MAGLGETVAELLAKARAAAGGEGAPSLEAVSNFGSNPGALRMWLHVPAALAPQPALVVVLHGCGQTPGGYAAGAGWLGLADRHGFAVLCPEQVRANNPNLCFTWFEDADIRRGAGEAESIAQMVGHAIRYRGLDPRRVFVTGLSAGGAMTAVMLAAYPELFAGGAIIAGLPYGAASGVREAMGAMRRIPAMPAKAWGDKVREARGSGPPIRWPLVSVWHGDADPTVTPAAADALVSQWCDVHGATEAKAATTAGARHTHTVWRRADGEIAVELHRIAGLGHGTPIAAGGSDGCGAPGPWILEAGVSSSQEIARSWALDATSRPQASASPKVKAEAGEPVAKLKPLPVVNDVGETIARALRSAGLMR